MKHKSILLVEDHRDLAETTGAYLTACGFLVDYAADGLTALHLAVTETFDAIVLDIMLPGVDGLEVCRRLREDAGLTTPIIMLTARDRLEDKLAGFERGSDDYLVKPFDMPELVARIESLIRRNEGIEQKLEVGDLILDAKTLEVTRAGKHLHLSKTLFEILKVLMRESPAVVTRETLERDIWGDDLPDSDTLRSHMYNLRRIVDRPFGSSLISTRPGLGYTLRAPADA